MTYIIHYIYESETANMVAVDVTTITCPEAKKLIYKAIKGDGTVIDPNGFVSDWFNDPNVVEVAFPCWIEGSVTVYEE